MSPRPLSEAIRRRLRPFGRAPGTVSKALAALLRHEESLLLGIAVVIGTAAGVAVIVFYKTIDLVQQVVLRGALGLQLPALIAIPVFVATGLALCRALVRFGAHRSPGENIPDVMYRVTKKGGVIPFVPVLVKTLGAGVVIGTGGSVGAEGPVVVLGAATASRIGRSLGASPNRLRTLVGCGAAAGISAAFNAPIAGVVFGIEKILGAASALALGPFVVASILAATVGRVAFGNHPVLAMPAAWSVGSPWELLLYAGLGLLTGAVAVAYSRGVWKMQDLFAELRAPWAQVALGAALVGGLDVVFRANLWGHGHQSVDLGLVASRTALFLLALAVAKLAATAITFGAGGTGGVFTPALFIGATLGGAYGVALAGLFPAAHVAPGALALVGMAGMVAGATHAPLTAIIMVFEMTGDYGLILPLMLTSVLAYGLARRLYPESIYTEWLVRRGVVLESGADAAVLARIPVRECMNAHPVVIPDHADVRTVLALIADSRQTDFPVVDADQRLVGMLSQASVRTALEDSRHLDAIALAADLAVSDRDPISGEDSLLTALHRFARRDVGVLPVVRPEDNERLEGIVTREDLNAAYERALTTEGH